MRILGVVRAVHGLRYFELNVERRGGKKKEKCDARARERKKIRKGHN